MALIPGAIGFGEARLKAIRDLLLVNLPALESQLSRTDEADTSYLLTDLYGGALTEDMVVRGDLLALWQRNSGCLRIVVMSGGHQSGQIHQSERVYMDVSPQRGQRYTFQTALHVYFHPDCWSQSEGVDMIAKREAAIERVSDWLTWIVFQGDALDLLLESRCYEDAEGTVFDHLTNGRLASVSTGAFMRAFGGNILLYGLQAVHVGQIE